MAECIWAEAVSAAVEISVEAAISEEGEEISEEAGLRETGDEI